MFGFKNKPAVQIEYSIRVSKKAKRVSISIYPNRSVVVTLPVRFKDPRNAEKFVQAKQAWILKNLSRVRTREGDVILESSRKEFLARKKEALALAKAKVEYWSKVYGIPYKKITVRNQKTRWGSASRKGNLNFNYNIVKLPNELVDYLIVHELCHLKEFNHSKKFWSLVAEGIPDFQKIRRHLKSRVK